MHLEHRQCRELEPISNNFACHTGLEMFDEAGTNSRESKVFKKSTHSTLLHVLYSNTVCNSFICSLIIEDAAYLNALIALLGYNWPSRLAGVLV